MQSATPVQLWVCRAHVGGGIDGKVQSVEGMARDEEASQRECVCVCVEGMRRRRGYDEARGAGRP